MDRLCLRAAVCAAAFGLAATAHAHDSWLSPAREPDAGGPLSLELATGNRFPVQEVGARAASVVQSRCSDGGSHTLALHPVREQPRWLDLAVPGRAVPLSCWLELDAFEIELAPALAAVYLAEIRAPAAVRDRWAALRQRRLPWRESYRKFARIELPSRGARGGQLAAARQAAGLDLEIVVRGDRPIEVGEPLEFQVLRDGRPLAGFPVELVSERSALGIWRETDGEGVLRHKLPFAGRWLLRGTDLRPSEADPGGWQSRFVTLAIEAPPQ